MPDANRPRIEIIVENIDIENVTIEGKNIIITTSKSLKNPRIHKKIEDIKEKTQDQKLYDRTALAKMLKVSAWTISTWVSSKMLPPHDLCLGSSRFWYADTILPHVQNLLKFRKINKSGNTRLMYINQMKK